MSQWFFSMRTSCDAFFERPMSDDERKALVDAPNPFARKNENAFIAGYLDKTFREAWEEFDRHVLQCEISDAYYMGVDTAAVERQWASAEVKPTQYFSDAGYADCTVTVQFENGIITAEDKK